MNTENLPNEALNTFPGELPFVPHHEPNKVYVNSQDTQQQLADIALSLYVPPDTEHVHDEHCNHATHSDVAEEAITGRSFIIPSGDFLVMAFIHPKYTGGEKVGQVALMMDENDYHTWVSKALKLGLQYGEVLAADQKTVINAFTATAVRQKVDGEAADLPSTMQISFRFDQVLQLLPYKEISQEIVNADRAKANRKKMLKRLADKQKSRKKMAAASRRRNR